MQVFLPYPNYRQSVMVLDPSRLGNQIYRECKTLVKGGWKNHPASKMWADHKYSLCCYALAGLAELRARGRDYPHHAEWFAEMREQFADTGKPPWIGDERLHLSHQSNLIRKDPDWYGELFPGVPSDLAYYWPTLDKEQAQ